MSVAPSGCRSSLPGTPGTNPKTTLKLLIQLGIFVPGDTGNKANLTGNTGSNSFREGAKACSLVGCTPLFVLGAPPRFRTIRREKDSRTAAHRRPDLRGQVRGSFWKWIKVRDGVDQAMLDSKIDDRANVTRSEFDTKR